MFPAPAPAPARRVGSLPDLIAGKPFGGWRAILADPPWRIEMYSAKGEAKSPQAHYRCMGLQDIADMPVALIACLDAVLFLWALPHMIPQALLVMDAWGFEPKTSVAWAKESKTSGVLDSDDAKHRFNFGTGYIFRNAWEILLVGTRGDPVWKPTRNLRNLIYAPVREHSRKPDEQYDMVEARCIGPYLELFSRADRPGWTHFGDQAGSLSAEAAVT